MPAPLPDSPATVLLPALTTAEVRVLYAAVHLFRSLVRHASSYDDAAGAGLRARALDVRTAVLHRFPRPGADGLFRYPPLTAAEVGFVRRALTHLADGLGHLGGYGPPLPDPEAPRRLLAKLLPGGQPMGSASE